MTKSKILITTSAAIFLALGVGGMVLKVKTSNSDKNTQERTVFFGPEKYQEGVESASKNPKKFFDEIEAGEKLVGQGDYKGAINYFEKSLRYISLEPQKAYVYKKIADAYKALGDMESEFSAVIMVGRFTKNDSEKAAYKQRADQIRQTLAAQ